jgi:hypothetical protein
MSNFLEKNRHVEQSHVSSFQAKEYQDQEQEQEQEQESLLELAPTSYRPDLHEEDVLYYGVVVQHGEPVEPIEPTKPIDVSLNNQAVALGQARDNACALLACEDYSVYDYEIMDEAMVAISNYDAGPRDDYNDDMYD